VFSQLNQNFFLSQGVEEQVDPVLPIFGYLLKKLLIGFILVWKIYFWNSKSVIQEKVIDLYAFSLLKGLIAIWSRALIFLFNTLHLGWLLLLRSWAGEAEGELAWLESRILLSFLRRFHERALV